MYIFVLTAGLSSPESGLLIAALKSNLDTFGNIEHNEHEHRKSNGCFDGRPDLKTPRTTHLDRGVHVCKDKHK